MLLELFFKFFIYSEFVDDCGIETEYEYGRGGTATAILFHM